MYRNFKRFVVNKVNVTIAKGLVLKLDVPAESPNIGIWNVNASFFKKRLKIHDTLFFTLPPTSQLRGTEIFKSQLCA